MEHNTIENKNDITRNRVSRSRFFYYVGLFCLVAFLLGGCYNLYKHKYPGKPDVTVQESSLYNPKYK